jgi:hypothetical protein
MMTAASIYAIIFATGGASALIDYTSANFFDDVARLHCCRDVH